MALPITARGTNPIILRLRQRRRELLLSQENIADITGYHVQTVRGAEDGAHKPSFNFVADYATALGLELHLCESSTPTKPIPKPSTTSIDVKENAHDM